MNKKQTKTKQVSSLLEYLLKEDVPVAPPQSSQEFAPVQTPKNISLDQTVDRYFVRYEKESIPTNDVYETRIHKKSFIKEQLDDDLGDLGGDDEEPEEGLDDLSGDLGGDDLGGEDGGDLGGDAEADAGESEPVVATPKINLNDFARSVARLVNNFQSLLDPKTVILNRAESYITNNYDQRTAQELMQVLEQNYGLKPVEVENTATQSESEFPQPYTAGAWGGSGG